MGLYTSMGLNFRFVSRPFEVYNPIYLNRKRFYPYFCICDSSSN